MEASRIAPRARIRIVRIPSRPDQRFAKASSKACPDFGNWRFLTNFAASAAPNSAR